MKKFRNILALLMVVVMLVAVMPMNVFAEGEHNITTEATNGTVTANPTSAVEGANVTLTVKPAEGYELDKLDIKAGESSVALTKDEETEKAFTMPAANVTVTATFKKTLDTLKKEAKEEVGKLSDLSQANKDAAEQAINAAKDKNGVDTALNEAKELDKAKKDAKDAVDKLDKLSNKDKEKFKQAIDDAADKAAVDKQVEDAKAKDKAKEEKKEKEDEKQNPPTPAAEKYDIYPKTVGNGTVTISAKKSEAGKFITVNATPNYGYVVDSIVVKDVYGNPLTLKNKIYKNYYDDYPYYLRSRWYRGYDYDDYIRWCDRYDYSRYDYSSFKRWCNWYGYNYDYDDFRRFYDWDDVYDYRWYNRYDYSYLNQADFVMPNLPVTVEVTFTSASYWYDDYHYYRYYRNKKDNYYERQKKAEEKAKEEEEAKAKAEAEKLPQVYENKAVIAIGSNVLDKVSKNVHTVHQMDAPAYVNGGRVMLPLRYVAEALGLQVSWVPETKTVIIWDLTQRVEIPVKSNRIIVNGITYTSDVKPEIKSSRTMLPIANIARALGLIDGSDIIWDQYNKQVTLTRKVLSK